MTAKDTAFLAYPGDQLQEIAGGTVAPNTIYMSPEGNIAIMQGLKQALANEAVAYNIDQVFSFTNNAANSYVEGQAVYWDGNNIQPTGFCRIGRAVANASSTQNVLVRLLKDARGARYAQVANSAALTNSTTATVLSQSPNIPANYLQAGDIIRFRYEGVVTSFNSTDTLATILQLYKVTSAAGVTIIAPTAYNGSANDVIAIEGDIVIRTIGANGTMVAHGTVAQGAHTSQTAKIFRLASTAIDTTQPLNLQATGTWSVANAGDSARSELFDVELLRA
jgi:hypothetical protein